MKILVLGAGGVGGYFGGRLAQGGADVTFLVRPRRHAQIAADGLRIASPLGDAALPVATVSAENLEPEFDLVLLTCKAFDLDGAIEAVRPGLSADGAVLPMLNGITHIDRLREAFGAPRVLGGTAQIAATLEPDGTVRHLGDFASIIFGGFDGTSPAHVVALAEMCEAAPGMTAETVPDAMAALWEKLVMLSTVAGMTTLMRASIGEINRAPGGTLLTRRYLAAMTEIARHAGYPPREAFLARVGGMVTNPSLGMTASMLRDLESGGPVEVDHIIGFSLDQARAHGVDDTLLSVAYTHLKAYQERRRRVA